MAILIRSFAFLLPKILNYLAVQSFNYTCNIPDQGYSRKYPCVLNYIFTGDILGRFFVDFRCCCCCFFCLFFFFFEFIMNLVILSKSLRRKMSKYFVLTFVICFSFLHLLMYYYDQLKGTSLSYLIYYLITNNIQISFTFVYPHKDVLHQL